MYHLKYTFLVCIWPAVVCSLSRTTPYIRPDPHNIPTPNATVIPELERRGRQGIASPSGISSFIALLLFHFYLYTQHILNSALRACGVGPEHWNLPDTKINKGSRILVYYRRSLFYYKFYTLFTINSSITNSRSVHNTNISLDYLVPLSVSSSNIGI